MSHISVVHVVLKNSKYIRTILGWVDEADLGVIVRFRRVLVAVDGQDAVDCADTVE